LAIAEEMRKRRWRLAPHDAARAPRRDPARVLRVAYASGSLMHDLDFALVEPALAAVLDRMPGVRLRLIGPLRTGATLAPFHDRIERLPFVPWQELCARL